MDIIKIKWHAVACLKKIMYKLIYCSNITFGSRTTFRSDFHIYLDGKAKIHIGNKCFFNNGCSINIMESLIIGEGTIFGENVKIYDHNHIYTNKDIPIKDQGYSIAPITIGSHCWIGSNVTILQGVSIGNNCVIGAGCLIYKDISDNKLVKCKTELIEKDI